MYNCLKLQKKSCSTDAVQQKRIICLTNSYYYSKYFTMYRTDDWEYYFLTVTENEKV